MVFSSLLFLTIFLPLTVGIYYLLPQRGRNLLLLAVSLVFYAWGEPLHIFIMLVTTLYIWGLGLLVTYYRNRGKEKLARLSLIAALVLSLGTLVFFKYTGFLVENLPFLKRIVPEDFAPLLPIGISFYTFQALSYVIDVYRGDVKAQKNWADFAMYISLFPQLIAGPIVRYSDVEGQLRGRRADYQDLYEGIRRFIIGLGKKVLLANQIGMIWEVLSHNGSVLGAWTAAIAFAFQIYFDFSAYSDMAIGMGRMFGFRFPENFRYPYQAASITEFWRRWHITLSTWFREYVYIPLGGNRKGKARQIFNLLVVWLLTGLWHGAAWQFLVWGLFYFVFLVAEKLFLLRWLEKVPAVVRHLYALLVILMGWVLFACEDVAAAGSLYRAMLGMGVPLADKGALFYAGNGIAILLLCAVGATRLPWYLTDKLRTAMPTRAFQYLSYGVLLVLLALCMVFLVADSYNPFLYFRF